MRDFKDLYQSGKTVFSTDDLRIIWEEQNPDALKSSIKYYIDTGRLFHLRKGVYAIIEDYNKLEVPQRIVIPSYISFETVLQGEGVIFQPSFSITSAAKYSKKIIVDNQDYDFHHFKEEILLNPLGIVQSQAIVIASKERAIADTIYLKGKIHFDNLRGIDKELLSKISNIYNQDTTYRYIQELISTL